jgi:molybdopterin/thiamine biosynthesis adenylyltransferase
MSEITFSNAELARYSRHLILPEFNIEGQKKLKAAKVLVVGTGGLGAPLLQYLSAAGVGTIGILDFDVVDASNLQRQVLFTLADVGRPKVEAAAERLQAQNPFVNYIIHNLRLTSENALEMIAQYDIVADGTDNFQTRYLVNDACVLLGKTNVYASIFRFEGQASVFNYRNEKGEWSPNYRDLFPEPPPAGMVPSCAEGGVLGVLPGILGTIQANEVIKVITGIGETLAGRLFLLDALTFETRTLDIVADPDQSAEWDSSDAEGIDRLRPFLRHSERQRSQVHQGNQRPGIGHLAKSETGLSIDRCARTLRIRNCQSRRLANPPQNGGRKCR